MTSPFDARPLLVAIAGPNGAGKTTCFESHVRPAGLRFVSADLVARELGLDAYEAAAVAGEIRKELVIQRESFAFETVFSDPAGEKLAFLVDAAAGGFTVLLCFVGVSGPDVCRARVAMRVSQGGHDVPDEKLDARFPRTMANLRRAARELPHVLVYDNDDLARPFRRVAEFRGDHVVFRADPSPAWLKAALRPRRRRP